jgi:hypothetical protein
VGFLEDHDATVNPPAEKWFSAEEGLNTITALLRALAAVPSSGYAAITAELRQLQDVLRAAQSRNVRWHLGIDD